MNSPSAPHSAVSVRRWHSVIEEIEIEGGKPLATPLRRVIVAAVITNPFAGTWADDLEQLIEIGAVLGTQLARRATALLGQPATSFGKAGIVGVQGELEHLAAVLHPKFGHSVRAMVGGNSILQSTKKRSVAGASIDIPFSHITAMMIRSHVDATTFSVPDAPLPNEMLICLALAGGERAHQRVGGLTEADAKGEDGMR